MAVKDLFSDDNEFQATKVQLKSLKKGEKQARKIQKSGMKGLKKDYDKALTSVDEGYNTGRTDITSGRDLALAEYQPFVDATAWAPRAYADALGGNGQEGYDRATTAFRTGPGYDFALNQGLEALNRTASSRGMLASGNNTMDLYNYAHGVADQEWDDYLDRLNGEQQFGADIAGRRAGIYTDTGNNLANLAMSRGGTRADILTQRGGAKYDFKSDLATRRYDTKLKAGEIKADYLRGLDQTGANVFGAITGTASLGKDLLNF